jgi:hypothetical protein
MSNYLNAGDTKRFSNSMAYGVNALVCALSWCVSYTDSRRQIQRRHSNAVGTVVSVLTATLKPYLRTVEQPK